MDWFDVDKEGLGKILSRKGKEFVLNELIQNAWDENTTTVNVTLERIAGSAYARLRVEDDNPSGFSDLSHAFTLFAESAKKGDAEKRGRFNLGEKLVLAVCRSASISTTSGTILFDAEGRHRSRRRTETGSVFEGEMRMTQDEMIGCSVAVSRLIPPPGIATIFNGQALVAPEMMVAFSASLPTEIADDEGFMRRSTRKTQIEVYEPTGEPGLLYEMGIPVVETGDRYHVNVCQKVPLNLDRDNVTPSYLAKLRALVLNEVHQTIDAEEANATWVKNAIQESGDLLSDAAIGGVMTARFGDKRVSFDPSDLEANRLAVVQGYTVVHGSQMSKAEWGHARRAEAIVPAGKITPSPKPFSPDGSPLSTVDREHWSPAVAEVVDYAIEIGTRITGVRTHVTVTDDWNWRFAAAYGPHGGLVINQKRLGQGFFTGPLHKINNLLIHEFGHHYASNHLSEEYYDALTDVGARLAGILMKRPDLAPERPD